MFEILYILQLVLTFYVFDKSGILKQTKELIDYVFYEKKHIDQETMLIVLLFMGCVFIVILPIIGLIMVFLLYYVFGEPIKNPFYKDRRYGK